MYKKHFAQCSFSATRPKTALASRVTSEAAATGTTGAVAGNTATKSTSSMSRSQFEEMTMLGLARRAERDRQKDGPDRLDNGNGCDDDDEDTKVYR